MEKQQNRAHVDSILCNLFSDNAYGHQFEIAFVLMLFSSLSVAQYDIKKKVYKQQMYTTPWGIGILVSYVTNCCKNLPLGTKWPNVVLIPIWLNVCKILYSSDATWTQN
jgi:hypothetical protein